MIWYISCHTIFVKISMIDARGSRQHPRLVFSSLINEYASAVSTRYIRITCLFSQRKRSVKLCDDSLSLVMVVMGLEIWIFKPRVCRPACTPAWVRTYSLQRYWYTYNMSLRVWFFRNPTVRMIRKTKVVISAQKTREGWTRGHTLIVNLIFTEVLCLATEPDPGTLTLSLTLCQPVVSAWMLCSVRL